jgi:hypothetical protein
MARIQKRPPLIFALTRLRPGNQATQLAIEKVESSVEFGALYGREFRRAGRFTAWHFEFRKGGR